MNENNNTNYAFAQTDPVVEEEIELPETGIFKYTETVQNSNGNYTTFSHLPYLEDYDGQFIPYRITEDNSMVQVEYDNFKFVFSKSDGAVTTFSNGTEVINSDSYVVKSATVNTDVWNLLDVNNSPVTTTVEDNPNEETILVTFTRENDEGIFKIEYDINYIAMKSTAYFTNLSLEDQKVSFTETLQIPNDIILNNGGNSTVIDIDDYLGQTISREVLEQNSDLFFQISDLFYTSGLGFDQLWSVSFHENRMVALDYGRQTEVVLDIGETMELDPTTTKTACQSGGGGSNNQILSCQSLGFSNVSGAQISSWTGKWTHQQRYGSGWQIHEKAQVYGCHTGGCANSGLKVRWGDSYGGAGGSICTDTTYDYTAGNSDLKWYDAECTGSGSATTNSILQSSASSMTIGITATTSPNRQTSHQGYWTLAITYTVPTAPTAPQNFSIDTQDVANEITLNWTAPSDDGGSSITGYKVYLAGSLIATLGDVLTYDDTISGGEIGSSLVYHVKATNAMGDSVATSTESVTAWNVPDTPATPTGVSGTNPVINWVAPSSDSPITGYKLYRDGSLHATLGNVLTATDSNSIVSGTTYAYLIKAISAVGESGSSSAVNIVAGVPADPPTNVQAVISDPNSSPLAVTITYTNPTNVGTGTLTGFQLLRNGTAVSTVGLTNTMSDTAPQGGQVFTYTVKSLSSHGTGTASSGSSVTTPNSPDQVTGLTVTPVSTSRIDLSWNTPSDNNSQLSGYKVQISSNGGSSYSDVLTGNVNTVYQALSLNGNAQYHFKVSAINAVGTGTASDVKNTYTMTTTPASLTATPVSEVQINLEWGN